MKPQRDFNEPFDPEERRDSIIVGIIVLTIVILVFIFG